MADGTYDMLLDAIARSAGVVLSLPAGDALRHHKSRFLSESPGGFWVAAPAGEQKRLAALIASQQPAGVSFRNSHLKVVFASPILRRDPRHPIRGAGQVDALLLSFPSEIKAVQRRASYRAPVPPDSDITARAWRIPAQGPAPARPQPSQELPCGVVDLCVGGIGLTFHGADGKPPNVTAADRLRIELTCPGGKLLIEGQVRYPLVPLTTETVRAGVQFKLAGDSKSTRQTVVQLTRIVGELQRDEVRRLRQSLCKPAS